MTKAQKVFVKVSKMSQKNLSKEDAKLLEKQWLSSNAFYRNSKTMDKFTYDKNLKKQFDLYNKAEIVRHNPKYEKFFSKLRSKLKNREGDIHTDNFMKYKPYYLSPLQPVD